MTHAEGNVTLSEVLAWAETRHVDVNSRLCLAPVFVWGWMPVTDEELEAAEGRATSGQQAEVARSALIDLVGRDILEEAAGELAATAEHGDIGRGADAHAILLVAGVAYAAVRALTSEVTFWLEAADKISRLWKKLRRKDAAPVLSLGAIIMLCAVDLRNRLGGISGASVTWAGDVGYGSRMDAGHTGEDLFGVIFARKSDMWIYVVDSHGQLVHFGAGSQPLHSGLRFYLDGEPVDPFPSGRPDGLLLNGPAESPDPDGGG